MPKGLSIDKAVDKHLKPVKDSDGTLTALEVSVDKVGVKDFTVAGNISSPLKVDGDLTLDASGDITLDAGGDIIFEAAGSDITMDAPLTITNTTAPQLTLIDTAGEYAQMSISGSGDLEIKTVGAGSTNSDINIDADGQINFKADSGIAYMLTGLLIGWGWVHSSKTFTIYGNDAATDMLNISCAANGASTIATVDASAGTDADLTLDADGAIALDSHTGEFLAKNAGTEFSAANSAYAGMILGCTHVFGSGANGVFQSVTTAWESLLWDTDKYALVTFVVPPSNKVKISVFLPYCQLSGYILQLGLATDSSATTLNTKYENQAWDVDETDTVAINHSWIVSGSDHSWSAGETKTLYIMAYADGSSRLYTGGTNTDKYGGVIVEATALPATIGDGSEP